MNQKLFSKDFTLVVIGQIISLFGNATIRFALPLYLLNLTGSSALYGTVTACAFIPAILLLVLPKIDVYSSPVRFISLPPANIAPDIPLQNGTEVIAPETSSVRLVELFNSMPLIYLSASCV